jgi:hypothetical protein
MGHRGRIELDGFTVGSTLESAAHDVEVMHKLLVAAVRAAGGSVRLTHEQIGETFNHTLHVEPELDGYTVSVWQPGLGGGRGE